MAENKSMYKKEHSFEQRKAEALQKRESHPERVPVILEKAIVKKKSKKTANDLPELAIKKFLVSGDSTFGQFVYNVQYDKMKLGKETALFFLVDNLMLPTASLMSAIYEEHKDEDGFLYMCYCAENTFGSV